MPPDLRDLNYEKFVELGESKITASHDYHSHNTERLDVAGIKALLEQLEMVKAFKRGERSEEEG